jgi:hypothetical protein
LLALGVTKNKPIAIAENKNDRIIIIKGAVLN